MLKPFLLTLLFAGGAFAADTKPAPLTPPSIVVVPTVGRVGAPGDPVQIGMGQFELLTLQGYSGETTWDISTDDSGTPCIWLSHRPAKSTLPGWRVGDKLPAEHVIPEAPTVAVFATATGRATISAWGVVDGRAKKLVSRVIDANTGPRPPPVPPGPTPIPPDPTPVPPPPVDPLTKALQDAANRESPADRAKLTKLAEAMEVATWIAGDAARSPTNAVLSGAVKVKTDELVGAGSLMLVRKAIGEHLNRELPTEVVNITVDSRPKFIAAYTAVHAALQKVK